jgi:hypothetical protein
MYTAFSIINPGVTFPWLYPLSSKGDAPPEGFCGMGSIKVFPPRQSTANTPNAPQMDGRLYQVRTNSRLSERSFISRSFCRKRRYAEVARFFQRKGTVLAFVQVTLQRFCSVDFQTGEVLCSEK